MPELLKNVYILIGTFIMANAVVRIKKEKAYIDEEARWRIAKIVGIPPRLVIRRRDRIDVLVNKTEKGIFIGKGGVIVRRLESELGAPIRVIGVDEDVDALSLNI